MQTIQSWSRSQTCRCRVRHHYKDIKILEYVQGVEIDLIEVPNQTKAPASKFQPQEFHLVDEAVNKLIEEEVIIKVPPAK